MNEIISKQLRNEIQERHHENEAKKVRRSKTQQARVISKLRKKYGFYKTLRKLGMN